MNTLPLPKVTEISLDDLAVLLPADCQIQLTACDKHRFVADKPELQTHPVITQVHTPYILIA